MTAHDDAMPDDITDAEAFLWDEMDDTYPCDDDCCRPQVEDDILDATDFNYWRYDR